MGPGPLGIPQAALTEDMTNTTPVVPDAMRRYLAHFPESEEWDRWTADERKWEIACHWAEIPRLWQVLTGAEIRALWWASVLYHYRMSEQLDPENKWAEDRLHLSEHPFNFPLWEAIRLALYQPSGSKDYATACRAYRALRTFSFLPGFDVTLDFPSPNRYLCGFATHHPDVWLDTRLGFCVYARGVHVLTIGIDLHSTTVFLGQVQLRRPQGNRWLYRLGEGLLSHTVHCLERAFGLPISVATGASVVARIREYHRKRPEAVTPEMAARLLAFYDGPVVDRTRGSIAVQTGNRSYQLMLPSGIAPSTDPHRPDQIGT